MSDLPRLLLCSFDVIPGPSGSSRRLTEYLKALPDRFSVVVLSAKTPDHSHIEKYQGARLLRVPVGSGDLASRIQAFERAVRRQLESEDYALAHFTDPFGGYALCELKGDYGYRLIYEAQTFPSQELRYTHPQTEGDRRFLSKVRRQELFCLMNADRIITGSETTRSYIQSLGASEELIRVVRAPVDLGPFSPDVLGAPDGEPLRLMYLGSHVGWQGLPTLLRAVALAAKQVEVRLTLVGAQHPDWQPHLDELVKELGLKDQVEFQPPVHHDDVAKVLALADVGVLALDDVERNRLQGGPLAKVSEYCAAGRPIIAADLPVCRELIPADAAVFFPVGDSQAMADRIVELARDVPRRIELGQRAREHAESALDAGVIRGQLLDIYDSLLDKRSVPVSGRSEDDLPAATMVTGTPTSRLASLLPPDSGRIKVPQPAKREPVEEKPAEPPSEAAAEEPPVVMGMVLEDGFDTRLIKTEPDARPIEPPVVMGLPLRERAAQTSSPSASSSTSVPTTSEPTPVTAQGIPPDPTPVTPRRTTEPEEPEQDAPEASPRREDAHEEGAAEERLSKVPPHGTPRLGDEPPAPTPVESQSARFPDESREEMGAKEVRDERAEEPSSPTPVVRAPAPLPMDEPPSPTPIIRMPASLRDDRGALARDGGSYSNGRHSTREEPPSPTPIIKAPAPLPFDEPPAPTPIVKAPAPLPRDEPPSPTPIVRSPLASRAEDDAPAPTPIIPARSVLASRSTSARVETPSRRMAPLTSQTKGAPDGDRGSTRADSERPSVRGAPVPDPERPAGRTGASADSEPPSVRGTPLPDAERPNGRTGADSERPSVRGTPAPEPERPSGRASADPERPSVRGTPVPEPERPSGRTSADSERPSVRGAPVPEPERPSTRGTPAPEPERPSGRTASITDERPSTRGTPVPEPERPSGRASADSDRPSVRGTPVPEPERPSGRTPTVPEPERASVRIPNPDSERPSVRSPLPELAARGHTTDPERNTPRPSGIVEPERPRTGETDRLPPLVRPSPPPDLSRSGSRGSALDPDRPPPILTPGAGTPSVGKSSLLGDLPPPDTDRAPPPPPPRATSAPPPVPRQRPPRLLSIDGPPRLEPIDTSASRPGLPAIRSPESEDEPEEISEDEAHAIEDGEEAGPTPPHSRPRLDDEPDEISSDEVEDAEVSASSAAQLVEDEDDLQEADADPIPDENEGPPPEPLSSTLNPWFAQLAHGYCPPEGTQFARHTPPTTFPGRDDDADPSRTPSAPRAPGVVRGKGS
ncbi:Glycosyltransferase involved in cell wall bisynthesis [Myxococcus fulvus]|uniref:Glycosyltransferase involved in cell wall bisynthesis n=1 Tax=Myxococcus fulvus TaxID=33 RepID=A0ABY1CR30_MYXFU|nr:glycosyltransferase family 4 protein [Myxococcus fulvus]SEU32184.1 Glycosyltransferase involved in cell wall bisynthesis [Myxococcus fulvus]